MPKSDNQKTKILYIMDYLERNSREDHLVRAGELIAMLDREHNISCDRKTIYSDIAALQEYGVDIVSIPGKSGGYYVASRNFELPELKLLIDAVQSSKYLTEKKSRELIEKLCRQCNEHDANLMRRNVLVSGRVKYSSRGENRRSSPGRMKATSTEAPALTPGVLLNTSTVNPSRNAITINALRSVSLSKTKRK